MEIDVSSNVQVELERNFQLLHDKLSTEFYQKFTEWEKLKSISPPGLYQPHSSQEHNSRTKCSAQDRDSSNALLLGEEQLTSQFKKKLDEWKQIKKGLSGISTPEQQIFKRRLTDWQIWKAPSKTETKPGGDSRKIHLSEEFLKKMDKWKKIKATRIENEYEDSNVTKSIRNSKVWKALDEKEFQPLEKIRGKIEKVQPKLDKQKDNNWEREARYLNFIKKH